MPIETLSRLFPGNLKEESSVNYAQAKNFIIQRSKAAGTFSSNKIRGVGVWRDEEDTVVNTGKKLIVNGSIEMGLNEYTTEYTYLSSHQQIESPVKPLTITEAKKLIKALEMFSWEKKENPIFLAGWIALSRVSGALSVRPHVWITGGKGAGKSMLINDLVLRCLGKGCTKVLGGTTAAGLRQATACDSRPIVFDEFEFLENNHKQNGAILDLLRQSWSFSTSAVIKGTRVETQPSICQTSRLFWGD